MGGQRTKSGLIGELTGTGQPLNFASHVDRSHSIVLKTK